MIYCQAASQSGSQAIEILCLFVSFPPIKLTRMQPNSLRKLPPNSPRSPQYSNI